MTARLAGRRALVTGGSSGIGAGIAERLAAEGADIAVVARLEAHDDDPAGRLKASVERLTRYGTRVASVAVDLTDEKQRATAVPTVVERLGGPVDILVNNAAAAIYQPLAEFPLRRRRLLFEANVHAPIDLAQAVAPAMREAGAGWIVNLTSGASRHDPGPPFELLPPGTDMAVYGASKAALARLTNGLGAELYGTGIRVNAIQPHAAVMTEGAASMMGGVLRPEQLESLEEMVEAAVALCDCSEDVTGRVCVSLDLIRSWSLTVRALDGTERRAPS